MFILEIENDIRKIDVIIFVYGDGTVKSLISYISSVDDLCCSFSILVEGHQLLIRGVVHAR